MEKKTEKLYEVDENRKRWRVSDSTDKAGVIYEVTKIQCPTKGGLEHFVVRAF